MNESYKVAVITVSDKGSKGEREDTGGPLVCEMLKEAGYTIEYTSIIPDDQKTIEEEIIKFTDENDVALIMTTGGTGFSQRDVTPEATIAVCERLVPGIPEAMRAESLKITNRAMLSRLASGIRKRTLIINLPGSPKAIKENLEVVIPALDHGLDILRGESVDCAVK